MRSLFSEKKKKKHIESLTLLICITDVTI